MDILHIGLSGPMKLEKLIKTNGKVTYREKETAKYSSAKNIFVCLFVWGVYIISVFQIREKVRCFCC